MKVYFHEWKEVQCFGSLVYSYTGKYNVLLWMSTVGQRPSCLGFRQVASARESLCTKSDNFQCRNFDIIFRRVRTFTGVVVDAASALAWFATSSTLIHLAEEILRHEKQQRWRRPQLGAKFLLRTPPWPVFSHKYLLDIWYLSHSMRSELWLRDASDTGGTVD